MDIDEEATLQTFGDLVGISRQAVAKHVENRVLRSGESYRQWLLAYCDRLRAEASGRRSSAGRERVDAAKARDSEASAQLKELELAKKYGLIIATDDAKNLILNLISAAKSEFANAIKSLVARIESQHHIKLEQADIDETINRSFRSLSQADYLKNLSEVLENGNR